MGLNGCLETRDAIGCLPHLSTRYGELHVAGCDAAWLAATKDRCDQ